MTDKNRIDDGQKKEQIFDSGGSKFVSSSKEATIIAELNKVKRGGMQDLIKWLTGSDFFTAPASTKYHSCFDGGLAEHNWKVLNLLKEKNRRYMLNLSDETIIICGLLHDLCKCNFYHKHMRLSYINNEPTYYYKVDDSFPIGHSEKSIILLQKFIKLTDEEIIMIRWHMGLPEVIWQDKMAFYKALELYPAALALYTADFEAATFLETKGVK